MHSVKWKTIYNWLTLSPWRMEQRCHSIKVYHRPFLIFFIISLHFWQSFDLLCIRCVLCAFTVTCMCLKHTFFFDLQLFITVGYVAALAQTLAHPHRQTERQRCIVGEVHWHAQCQAFWQKTVRMKWEPKRCLMSLKCQNFPKQGAF